MGGQARNATDVGRALANWWAAEAKGEPHTAAIWEAATLEAAQAVNRCSALEVEQAYKDEQVLACWKEFYLAKSPADRKRIAEAAALRLLKVAPCRPAPQVQDDQRGADIPVVRVLEPTDSLYHTPKPQGLAMVLTMAALMLFMYLCSRP